MPLSPEDSTSSAEEASGPHSGEHDLARRADPSAPPGGRSQRPPRRLSRRTWLVGLAGLAGLGLAGGALGRLIFVLNKYPARYIYRGQSPWITALAWSPTSQRIASGAEKTSRCGMP